MNPVLETERLIIRRWDVERDLDDAFAIYGDGETMRFIPCGALDRERTRNLIDRMRRREEDQGFGIWPVVHKSQNRVIGECGIAFIPEHGKAVEIAWIFNSAYHGQGFATEAARAVMRHALEKLSIRPLHALIDRENHRSIALANRLGLRFNGIIRAYHRDLMRYRTA